jgi:hypothetical protein
MQSNPTLPAAVLIDPYRRRRIVRRISADHDG